ncbi:late promoter transcription accessory protein [Escherichia phage vB_EcoM_VR20]|uniref:Late transcription coactivator n=1 Tax=Escherichia phage vB_EcoM_VR20 TaxID=1567027 RepID=A0A0A7HCD1_9CAUD|nr:late promoter transcriptional regulator [Escherichia phage vB_EcoM_VR20]AIZ02313.1 late promoter transcription accessory protein [Escherichia phage vB_EcoM_VR20]WCD43701.1 late promoter transcription accessory protein [Escherichia phage ECML-359]WMU95643.1 late promoter transcription accessory protein [Escherichia phage pEC-M719-6WT.2]
MMSSLVNFDTQKTESPSGAISKQQNGLDIEAMVESTEMSYLEAATAWLEERGIPEGNFARYIPAGIIDKIMNEAYDDNLLRPSMSRTQKTNTLDFLL